MNASVNACNMKMTMEAGQTYIGNKEFSSGHEVGEKEKGKGV